MEDGWCVVHRTAWNVAPQPDVSDTSKPVESIGNWSVRIKNAFGPQSGSEGLGDIASGSKRGIVPYNALLKWQDGAPTPRIVPCTQ
ncbi:hypothetical protein BC830DRAFT_1110038 [Chytriomyces sp. MP71]|nr:hypothetical protein BC830DRAFT_1110038 [Chytriomyces sp. MP71]